MVSEHSILRPSMTVQTKVDTSSSISDLKKFILERLRTPSWFSELSAMPEEVRGRTILVVVHYPAHEVNNPVIYRALSGIGLIEDVRYLPAESGFHSRVQFQKKFDADWAHRYYNGMYLPEACCKLEIHWCNDVISWNAQWINDIKIAYEADDTHVVKIDDGLLGKELKNDMMINREEEQPEIQMRGELNVEKEISPLGARQVFTKMTNSQICHEHELSVDMTKELGTIDHVELNLKVSTVMTALEQHNSKVDKFDEHIQGDLLASSDDDQDSSNVLVIDELNDTVPCFDPGGGFKISVLAEVGEISGESHSLEISNKTERCCYCINLARKANWITHTSLDHIDVGIPNMCAHWTALLGLYAGENGLILAEFSVFKPEPLTATSESKEIEMVYPVSIIASIIPKVENGKVCLNTNAQDKPCEDAQFINESEFIGLLTRSNEKSDSLRVFVIGNHATKLVYDPGGELFKKFIELFQQKFHSNILYLLRYDTTDYKGPACILCFDSTGVNSTYVQYVTHLFMRADLCCGVRALTDVGDCPHVKYQSKLFEGPMKSLQQNNLICIETRSERGLLIMLEMKDINSEMASMVTYDFLQIFNQGAIKCELLKFLPMKRRMISGYLREEIPAFDQHAIKRALACLSSNLMKRNALSNIPSRIEVLNSSLRINFVPGDIFIEIIDVFFKAYEHGDNTYSAEASLSWPSDSIEVFMVIFQLNFAMFIRTSCHVLHLLNKIKKLTEDNDSMDIFIFDPGGELMLDYLVPCLPNESELGDSSLSKVKNMYELLRSILDTGLQVDLVSARNGYLVALILCMSKVAIIDDVLKLLLIYPIFCSAVKPAGLGKIQELNSHFIAIVITHIAAIGSAVFWDETQIQLEDSLPYFMLYDLEIDQIRLLAAAGHFESIKTSIVVFIFDPGGGSYFCFAILIVQCPSQQCYQRQLQALRSYYRVVICFLYEHLC